MQPVGMLDWLTLAIDGSFLSDSARRYVLENSDRIQRFNPKNGEVRWETVVRESIRSDSHHVTVSFGSRLTIQGSPARIHSCNNVFGSLDIQRCALDMIEFVAKHWSIIIPRNLKLWSCSKIDVTQNFDLGSLNEVKHAIDCFKPLKIGRQRTSTEDTTVMWGKGSTLHMGKIYAKGPHARKMFIGRSALFTEEELLKADRLLRVEYSIRRLMIRRLKESGLDWYELTPEQLLSLHRDYFDKFISSVEVFEMDDVLGKLIANVGDGEGKIKTVGQAKTAHACYLTCRELGLHRAKECFTSSWYRHLKNLKTIGIVPADLQASNVVQLRRRPIVLDKAVSSWDDIKLAQRA